MANLNAKLLLVAVTLAAIFIGSAAQAEVCKSKHLKDCDPVKPGCETVITKDPRNCGDCGIVCKVLPNASTMCMGGNCRYSCRPRWGDCDKNILSNGCETNTGNDAKNCGKCGKVCQQVPFAETKCLNSRCLEPVCNAGRGNCDLDMLSNGCEKDLTTDDQNCGMCGNKCTTTVPGGVPICRNGVCGVAGQ